MTGSLNVNKYKLTQAFGADKAWYKANLGTNGHPGIDTGQSPGAAVLCEEDGTVVGRYANDPTAGNFLVVKTKGGTMRYLHLKSFFVKSGAKVKRGQSLGGADTTGLAYGSHLHLDFKPNVFNPWNGFGGRTDPLKYLAKYVSAPVPKKPLVYTVRSGDSLSAIAKKYKTTWQKLVELNKSRYPSLSKNPNYINVGWKLIVKK